MKFKHFLLLLLLAALWGPSFLFIKIAVETIPPITLVLGRIGIAAILLWLFLRFSGGKLPTSGRVWGLLAVMALVQNAVPFVLFSWSEQYIDSALASILNGATPLFTIFLAHFYIQDDRLSVMKLVGALIGFGGLVVLVIPSFLDGVQATTLGVLAMTLAASLYGIALVYSRKYLRGLPPLVAPAGQMILATLFLLPAALIVERPFQLPMPSIPALLSVLELGVLGTAVAFIVYYRLIAEVSASHVSMVTYIIPIIGVILGVVILKEQLSWHSYVGCGLILFGVAIVNGVFKKQRLRWPLTTHRLKESAH